MNSTFSRALTSLRKERGISQKQAATALGISQALLSHYEKGIRECGLDFVVRTANFYGVSCDYLLGRTPDKSGTMITVTDTPETNNSESAKDRELSAVNKKQLLHSVSVLFDLLPQYKNSELTDEVSHYLNLAVYTVFRHLYGTNPRLAEPLFSVPAHLFAPSANGAMGITAANVAHLAEKTDEYTRTAILNELSEKYPLFAPSLWNVVKNAENKLNT